MGTDEVVTDGSGETNAESLIAVASQTGKSVLTVDVLIGKTQGYVNLGFVCGLLVSVGLVLFFPETPVLTRLGHGLVLAWGISQSLILALRRKYAGYRLVPVDSTNVDCKPVSPDSVS
jgi:hypothetical protein